MAEVYNQNMSGVDMLYQKLASYMYPHKCQKYYTLFHRAVEVKLVNGYIVHCTASDDDSKMPVKNFRQSVIEGLLNNYTAPSVKIGRRIATNKPV